MKKKMKKTWITLYSITAFLFFVTGIAMLIFDWDSKLIDGLKLVVTSIIFAFAIFLIIIKKVELYFNNPKLTLGFIFSIIGASSTLRTPFEIIWIIGTLLFISGLFFARKKSNRD